MATLDISQIKEYGKEHGNENFSPKINKLIKESDNFKQILEDILNYIPEEELTFSENTKKIFLEIIKNNKDKIKENNSNFILFANNLFITLQKLESNEPIYFTDLDEIQESVSNLKKMGININFENKINIIHDKALKQLNNGKQNPRGKRFIESLKLKNPEQLEKLKERYRELKQFYKEKNLESSTFNFNLEGVREELMFESWIDSELKPMYYSEKQQSYFEHIKTAIDQNGNIVEYSEINNINNNFKDAIYLGYGIINEVIPKKI